MDGSLKSTSNDTLKTYATIADRILRRFTVESGVLLIDWLSAQASDLAPASWRLYRAALFNYFESNNQPNVATAIQAIPTSDATDTERTSALKFKHVPDDIWQTLCCRLKETDAGLIATEWIENGILTGLRPSEWQHVRLIETGTDPFLIVQNAKTTNGRSHGMYRTIHLNTDYSDTQRLKAFLDRLLTGDFEQIRTAAEKALYRANEECFPSAEQHISLYSARHQFAADAKACGVTMHELAALMGHASINTASTHYGKRRLGRSGGFRVKADDQDVARVLELNPNLQLQRHSQSMKEAC